MSNQQQTVYRLENKEGYKSIKPRSEPIPAPTKFEVLIQIKAVALNYRDVAISNGSYPFPVTDKVVPVSDCAAVVVAVGDGVESVTKGDKVVVTFDGTNQYGPQRDWNHGHGGPVDGFLRQYAVVAASAVVKIPGDTKLGWPQLASLVCTGVTAWNALFGPVQVRPGQIVLVQGSSMSTLFPTIATTD